MLPGKWLRAEVKDLQAGTDVEAEADVEAKEGANEEVDIGMDPDKDTSGRVCSPA